MIIVDVETTGLDALTHSIISIGAVDFSNCENKFYRECQPWEGADVTDESINTHGISRVQMYDPNKPSLEEAMLGFVEWVKKIKDKTIGGQNVGGFDIKFLNASLKRYGIPFDFGHRSRDIHTTACDVYDRLVGLRGDLPVLPTRNGMSGFNLDEILKFVGLNPEPKPHNALTGAKLEAEAYNRLLFGKGLLPEYSGFVLPKYLSEL